MSRMRRDIRLMNKWMRREAYRWGQQVEWYEFDPTSVDDSTDLDLYDEGGTQARPGTNDTGTSRHWKAPKLVQVYMARVDEGMEVYNEEGTYIVDRLTITTSRQLLIDHGIDPWVDHESDRIVFDGRLFNVNHFENRGWIADTNTVCTITAVEVKEDEMQVEAQPWYG